VGGLAEPLEPLEFSAMGHCRHARSESSQPPPIIASTVSFTRKPNTMSKAYKNYEDARREAFHRARESDLDYAIEKLDSPLEGGVYYIVRAIPFPPFSFGCDARAERVTPQDAKREPETWISFDPRTKED